MDGARMDSVIDLFQDDVQDFGMDIEFGYRDIKKAWSRESGFIN